MGKLPVGDCNLMASSVFIEHNSLSQVSITLAAECSTDCSTFGKGSKQQICKLQKNMKSNVSEITTLILQSIVVAQVIFSSH